MMKNIIRDCDYAYILARSHLKKKFKTLQKVIKKVK